MQGALDATPASYASEPLLGGETPVGQREPPQSVRNPANHGDIVGTVVAATTDDVATAIAVAVEAGSEWSRRPAKDRATLLERVADALEESRASLIALAVREAGKTMVNALGEVREAADFCRYYAAQARREFADRQAIGPVVCITPWNFPLAIFVGEISAALAAGNPVLAKPAEQTPLMAAAVAACFTRQACRRRAATVTRSRRWWGRRGRRSADHGVLFTGSNPVATAINRQLALRADDPVLIAETGGQNAMIVDSSALPEQVVNDAITSAFDSAGQRCSALRLLCVQRDVAGRIITMLEGAMREIRLGDPRDLATDVGPVIDADAQSSLIAHIDRMRAAGMRVVQGELPAACAYGTYVPPTLIEIDRISRLEREVFGPVLHVLRFDREDLTRVIDAINATGYDHMESSRASTRPSTRSSRRCAPAISTSTATSSARRRRATVRWRRTVGHGPEGGRPAAHAALASAARERAPSAAQQRDRLPDPPARRIRGRCIRAAGSAVSPVAKRRCASRLRWSRASAAGRWIEDSSLARKIAASMPAGNVEIVDDLLRANPAALLIADPRQAQQWKGRIAPRSTPDRSRHHSRSGRRLGDNDRLVMERVVTINTTASGGNAELLAAAG